MLLVWRYKVKVEAAKLQVIWSEITGKWVVHWRMTDLEKKTGYFLQKKSDKEQIKGSKVVFVAQRMCTPITTERATK